MVVFPAVGKEVENDIDIVEGLPAGARAIPRFVDPLFRRTA